MYPRSPVHCLAAVDELSADKKAKLTPVAASSPRDNSSRLHASAVVIGEAGVLIRGRSGAGKSSLAAVLISAAHQAGRFAALIGDDRIELSLRSGRVIARGHPAIHGLIELRGQGIVALPNERAAIVRLIIDLLPVNEIARYPDETDREVELCGAKVPRLALSASSSSRDCAVRAMMHLQHAGIF